MDQKKKNEFITKTLQYEYYHDKYTKPVSGTEFAEHFYLKNKGNVFIKKNYFTKYV